MPLLSPPLPTGLVPVVVGALTVGVAVPATAAAHLLSRRGRPFAAALRVALAGTAVAALVGVAAVWVAVGPALWEVPAALLAGCVAASLLIVGLPLWVGRELVGRLAGAAPDDALRYAAYGWPVAATGVLAVFVGPGGLSGGDLLHLDGRAVCLAGFCGVPLPLVGAVVAELAVAVLGPGAVGTALRVATAERAVPPRR